MPIQVLEYVWEGLVYSMAVGFPLLVVLLIMVLLSEAMNGGI